MRTFSVRERWIAAIGLLGAGAAYAGHLATTPPAVKTPDTAQMRLLAERIASGSSTPAVSLKTPVLPAGSYPSDSDTSRPAVRVQKASADSNRTPAGQVSHAPAPAPAPTAADQVKNIALVGVTHSDGEDHAWLMDVSTQEREVVDEGGAAWGFTVKDISDEQIILARGTDQFTIRLGDKEVPVAYADTASSDPAAGGSGFGNRGGGDGDRNARRERFRQMMASGAFGGFGGRGGRPWGGGSGNWSGRGGNRSWGGSSNSSSNWRGGSSNGGGSNNRGGRSFSSNTGRSWGGGGFNPSSVAWGMNYMGNRGGAFGGGTAGSTSNPQTARRRGGQLIGGATPLPNPQSIRNPQTTRRLGTNSGQAFGSGNSSWNRGGSNSRTGTRSR